MSSEALILCIDTSETQCSVALCSSNAVLFTLAETEQKSHAAKLLSMVNDSLAWLNITLKDLAAIAVSAGPGSYTGLRIGVSSIKGLCMATNTPVIAINTLEALATQAIIENKAQYDYFIPTLNARRSEIYTLVMNKNRQICLDTHALVLEKDSLQDYLSMGKCLVMGSGAKKVKQLVNDWGCTVWAPELIPHAAQLRLLAFERWHKKQFEQIDTWEPNYLKEFYSAGFKK
jgi:tRNA threonylcarbamoyladenosine biosynthesis protein TsaB